MSDLLDTKQVGDLLGIKQETVRWYHKRGVLPPCDHRFGRTPVWQKSTIEDWQSRRTEITEVPLTDGSQTWMAHHPHTESEGDFVRE